MENLVELAARQFDFSKSHCGVCRLYHSAWPYLRLAGQVGGIEADRAVVQTALDRACSGNDASVLIAGSADAGLSSTLLGCLGARISSLTVADRCQTPLLTCKTALAENIRLQTLHLDLRSLTLESEVDLVFAHSVLPFFDVEGRLAMLDRLRRALTGAGRLVMVARLSAPGEDKDVLPDIKRKWGQELSLSTLERLEAKGVPLPCPSSGFQELIASLACYQLRLPYRAEEDIVLELEHAGFKIVSLAHGGKGTAFLDNGQIMRNARQGVVITARR